MRSIASKFAVGMLCIMPSLAGGAFAQTAAASSSQVSAPSWTSVAQNTLVGQIVYDPQGKAVGSVVKVLAGKAGKPHKLVVALKNYPGVADNAFAFGPGMVRAVSAANSVGYTLQLKVRAEHIARMKPYTA